MQRALLSWTLVFALLLAGFGASVLALNGDVFSAHGFVRSYLETLARHDAAEALDFDGVVVPADVSEDLLSDAALGDISDIHLLSDVETGDTHLVRFEYAMGGAAAVSEFTVERTGTRLGFFATWRFAVSPIAILNAEADHDARLTANGFDSFSGAHAVLMPGYFVLDHESKYLTANEVGASVTAAGNTVDAVVEVTANDTFASAAADTIAAFLDKCATQEVLKPTGCPFGTKVVNRLNSTPAWSMVEYPEAQLSPTKTAGVWEVSAVDAVAHIIAEVKSLFDGTVTPLDEDVPFTSSYLITVAPDDSLIVTVPA